MVSLPALFTSLSPRRNIFTMVSAPVRKLFSKGETPLTTPSPAPPSPAQLQPTLNTSPLPPPIPEPLPLPQNDASSPDSPDGSGDDFLADIFSDSDDDTDSDSDEDRRTFPKFDYDARFRPLQKLDLSAVWDPDPEAEMCYILEDFGPENMKSWCLPDFVSTDVFAVVKGGEPVDFIREFNEFFWREYLVVFPNVATNSVERGPVVRVHRTGKAGVVPAFNIEGHFEREARHNKEANEKVCMPRLAHPNLNPLTMSRQQSHQRASSRRSFKDHNTTHDADLLTSIFVEDESNEQPRNPRSVGFKSIAPQKVFRYVAPDYTPVGKEPTESVSWIKGWVEVVCTEDESLENVDAWRPGRGRIRHGGFRRFRM